jgi:ferredoxin
MTKEVSRMNVRIDREECLSCAACWEDCPEVFEENESDGLSQIVAAYQVNRDPAVGQVPVELEECVRTAADGCPVEIIHIEE